MGVSSRSWRGHHVKGGRAAPPKVYAVVEDEPAKIDGDLDSRPLSLLLRPDWKDTQVRRRKEKKEKTKAGCGQQHTILNKKKKENDL